MKVEGVPTDLEFYLDQSKDIHPTIRALASEVKRLRVRIDAGLDELYRLNTAQRECLDSYNTLTHRKGQ